MSVVKKTMKKNHTDQSEEKKPSKPVRIVTEIVEEMPDESLKEIKEDAQNIERTVEELEAVVNKEKVEELTPTVQNDNQAPLDSTEQVVEVNTNIEEPSKSQLVPEESRNVVVEKLFKQDTAGIASELTIEKRGNPMKSLFIWVFTVLIVAVATGGLLLLLVRGVPAISSFSLGAAPTPTSTPMPTPTPTPIAIQKSSVKIQVLNGGGTAGAGSSMKKLLETKGYVVSSVGNTDSYNYEKTEIVVKKSQEQLKNMLTNDLKDTYSLQDSTTTLPDDASYDAQVIVGK